MPNHGPRAPRPAPSLRRALAAWLFSVTLSAPLGYGLPALVSWSQQQDLLALGAFLALSGPTLLVTTWMYRGIMQLPRRPWSLPWQIVSICSAPFVWYPVVVGLVSLSPMECGIVECGNKWVFWGTLGGVWWSGMLGYFILSWSIHDTPA